MQHHLFDLTNLEASGEVLEAFGGEGREMLGSYFCTIRLISKNMTINWAYKLSLRLTLFSMAIYFNYISVFLPKHWYLL